MGGESAVGRNVEIAWYNGLPIREPPKVDYVWIHDKYGYLICKINGCGSYPIRDIHKFEFENVKVKNIAFAHTEDRELIADITLDELSKDVGYDIRERVTIHANDTVIVRRTLIIAKRER